MQDKNDDQPEVFVYSWIVDPNEDETNIRAYGINTHNKSVCIRVDDFTPFCYIEIPNATVLIDVEKAVKRLCIETRVVRRRQLYNAFNEDEELGTFLRCRCRTRRNVFYIHSICNKGVYVQGLGRVTLKVHEREATPVLQLISQQDLTAAGWIKVGQTSPVSIQNMITRCDVEYIISSRTLKRSDNVRSVVPRCVAFDIEVNSDFVSQMPQDRPNDVVFQISCVCTGPDIDSPEPRKILFSLNASTRIEIEGVEVFEHRTEEELLMAFMQFVYETRPNVLCGFNILGFDIEYLIKRCARLHLMNELKELGYHKTLPAEQESVKWTSNAYKNQEFTFLNWEGILLLDLLPIVRRDFKLDTYSLKNVAATLLKNDSKDPLTHKDIFAAYRTRTNMDQVGKYCVQDSNLCIRLMEHLHSWIALSEMAKVCNVTMFTLYTQGQQIKTYSQVYKYCHTQRIVVTSQGYETKANERYTGAYVFDPVPGVYENVVPFDFSSLYPSIIIAKNICYSTLVQSKNTPDTDCNVFEWEDHVGCEHDPRVVEIADLSAQIEVVDGEIKKLMALRDGVRDKRGLNKDDRKRYQAQINALRESQRPHREKRQLLKKTKPSNREDEHGQPISGIICERRRYRFLKSSVRRGVVPTIIQHLLDSRVAVRQRMKTALPEVALVLDKEQNAYKISANSMYGAMGVRRGYLPLMPGAMCVTYFGRVAIEQASREITSKWGGRLIYGDTDSNYVVFPALRSVDEIWKHAVEVAGEVSRVFPAPMKLEFEQTIYSRFLILSKKRYIFQAVDRDGVLAPKVGKKGVVLSRRDNSKFVRDLYERLAMMIFEQSPRQAVVDLIICAINDLYRGVYSHDFFVITKSVGDTAELVDNRLGDYKLRDGAENQGREYHISQCPAHIQLAERMCNRGFPVSAGSRLEFVVVKKHHARSLADRIEEYDYFKKRSSILRIDPEYYLNSIINPLDQLLSIGIHQDNFVKAQHQLREQYSKVLDQLRTLARPRLVLK